MRYAVDPRFRATLANLIVLRGISQAKLARDAHVSPAHLSEILNDKGQPSAQTARALDDALTADGALTNLVIPAAAPDDMDQIAAAAANPRRISTKTVDSLANVLHAQRHLDDVAGSASVLGSTLANMSLVTTLVAETSGPQRAPLLYVAGQWAQFAGWLSINTGRMDDANRWLGAALLWADELDDPDLQATVLSYQAHAHWLSYRIAPAEGLALAALRKDRAYPGQRAYDAFAVARTRAAAGAVDDARTMLATADELAEQANTWTGPVPPWQYYRAPWYWDLERGLVWTYTARFAPTYAQTAAALLTAGLGGMPEEMRGADWAGEYRTQLAAALITAGDLDGAQEQVRLAGDIAEATDSKRVQRLVEAQERKLRITRDGL